jgi:DNA polymerase/3'-5' exonuclease PolX
MEDDMKQKIPLARAKVIAENIVKRLQPHCLRIEIAGSIRRGKPEVGDIEVVVEPFPTRDLFGEETYEPHSVDEIDWTDWGQLIKGGHKYKQVLLSEKMDIHLDLFIVTPPAQWGVQFLIRTGPAEYSHRFVTSKQFGGMMPSCFKVKDGAIWKGDRLLETPEERDVYALIGAEFVEPNRRMT